MGLNNTETVGPFQEIEETSNISDRVSIFDELFMTKIKRVKCCGGYKTITWFMARHPGRPPIVGNLFTTRIEHRGQEEHSVHPVSL